MRLACGEAQKREMRRNREHWNNASPGRSNRRRQRSAEEKRRMVEAMVAPERSVTEVAQAHGVRANHLPRIAHQAFYFAVVVPFGGPPESLSILPPVLAVVEFSSLFRFRLGQTYALETILEAANAFSQTFAQLR